MIVILHVVIALFSIIVTTVAYVRPAQTTLRFAYGLVAATLGSGVYLVWVSPTHMIEACMMGLAYTGIVSIGIFAARAKLATVSNAMETN